MLLAQEDILESEVLSEAINFKSKKSLAILILLFLLASRYIFTLAAGALLPKPPNDSANISLPLTSCPATNCAVNSPNPSAAGSKINRSVTDDAILTGVEANFPVLKTRPASP